MKPKVGLWIDQRKAVIVFIFHNGEDIKTIESNIDKYFQPSIGNLDHSNITDFGRMDFPAYDIVERDCEMHIQKFYDKVISLVYNADPILVFGPGESKINLKKRMEMNKAITKNIIMETTDKLTDNEIAEKVRHHYRVKSLSSV